MSREVWRLYYAQLEGKWITVCSCINLGSKVLVCVSTEFESAIGFGWPKRYLLGKNAVFYHC